MRLKNFHLFLVGFMMVSLVLLTGFKNPDVETPPGESINTKEAQIKGKKSSVELNQKKNKYSVRRSNEDTDPQKSLDLSIPFKDAENSWQKVEQNKGATGESSNMFASEHKQKPQPVNLDGQLLMTQEPETDKRKSVDGAGIVIKLKQ